MDDTRTERVNHDASRGAIVTKVGVLSGFVVGVKLVETKAEKRAGTKRKRRDYSLSTRYPNLNCDRARHNRRFGVKVRPTPRVSSGLSRVCGSEVEGSRLIERA